jgi:exopolyphosphatase/guanosine-5'-triphosphate,3'-diphosphate pyrophosphatase
MRVGVVDIGTNSTRLLIADATAEGRVEEIDRRTQVTRLGDGVDANGALAPASIARVFAALDGYRDALDAADVPADARIAVLTSAVRDASNGAGFTAEVRDRYGLDAQTISGDREARLTFLGATHDRARDDRTPLLVYDIGGGSTELVVGHAGAVDFHVSTQAGVVRQTERHIRHDPPHLDELQAIAREIREIIVAAVPAEVRTRPRAAIGVAGTATSLAALDQALDPYDPAKVHGYVATLDSAQRALALLASLPLELRREAPGLHPDRAPTIVAGLVILIEVLEAFGLDRTEVSEHDILHGAVLDRARGAGDGAA